MQIGDGPTGGRGRRSAPLLALVVLAVALGGAGPTTATLALALAASGRSRGMPGLLGSIAIGALVLGILGWVGATVLDGGIGIEAAAGLGVAVGGGLGAIIWFLAVGDTADRESRETVAVEMQEGEGAEPAPEPADLFAANPDPIVYFAGERPVVRTVNPAFEEVFGVSAGTLEDADLDEALMAEGGADDLLEAIGQGESYDEVHDCETVDGPRSMRLRLAVTGTGDRTDGYVIYTPVGETD